jgi:hypothetical protein
VKISRFRMKETDTDFDITLISYQINNTIITNGILAIIAYITMRYGDIDVNIYPLMTFIFVICMTNAISLICFNLYGRTGIFHPEIYGIDIINSMMILCTVFWYLGSLRLLLNLAERYINEHNKIVVPIIIFGYIFMCLVFVVLNFMTKSKKEEHKFNINCSQTCKCGPKCKCSEKDD